LSKIFNNFQIATLCGAKRAKQRWNYFSKGTGMCVVMVTDKSTVSAGFKANYQVILLGMKIQTFQGKNGMFVTKFLGC
jgi:hypothetical protein